MLTLTVYQGQEQHYGGGATPGNREALWLSGYNTTHPLYTLVTGLNVFRKRFSDSNDYLKSPSVAIYNATNTLALKKGQAVTVLNNVGSSGPTYNITLGSTATGYAAGDLLTEVVSCRNTTVDSDGNLNIAISDGLPSVFYPTKLLTGSAICKDGTTTFKAPPLTTTAGSTNPTRTGSSKATGSSGSGTGSGSSGDGGKSAGVMRRVDGNSAILVFSGMVAFLMAQNLFY
jgi:alpha-amylase